MSRYHLEVGAPKLLNKTIFELMTHMGDDGDRPNGDSE